MVDDFFLMLVGVFFCNVYCLCGELLVEAEVGCYGEEIKECLAMKDGWLVFDFIMLGMGGDGYIVFIFFY